MASCCMKQKKKKRKMSNKEVDEDQVITMLKNKKIRTSSPPIGHRQNMVLNRFDLLPEEVIIDQILLKLPMESLLNLRCVCKCLRSLITSPSFVQFHYSQQLAAHDIDDLILFCPRTVVPHSNVSPAETVEMLHCPFPFTDIRASCNGLLYVHGRPICTMYSWPTNDHSLSGGYMYVYTTVTKITRRNNCTIAPTNTNITRRISPSYIWNPCTKEYKELRPPPPSTSLLKEDQHVLHFDDQLNDFAILSASSTCNGFGFCGFGYDCANDDYKVLHYEYLLNSESISVPTAEFKIYRLKADTWMNISDNPYRSLFFGQQWLKIGLFVNGALHWIMSSEVSSRCATKAKIISFDIEKEVFTEIQKPPLLKEREYYGNLQTLQGCLCVCQFPLPDKNNVVDIWMLKDYAVKDSWTKFLRVVISGILNGPYRFNERLSIKYFKLLRYCENGEIAMLRNCIDVVLYHPFHHTATPAPKFIEDVKKMNYRKSLAPLNSGTYTR